MTVDGAERSIEIERKYDADDATPLPRWDELPGIFEVGEAEPRELDARYLDTADGMLGRASAALRRRTGGPDEGWHIKQSTDHGKIETRWPFDVAPASGSGDQVIVPEVILAAVAAFGDTSGGLAPIARIRNARTAYALRDAEGAVVAEFVDDHVTATDLRRGVETRWREWELELGPAAPADADGRAAFFAAADALVVAAGGRVSSAESKLGRALGL